MNQQDPNPDSGFATTRWSMVGCGSGSANRQEALEWLCRAYWRPVYGHVRRKGNDHDAAMDLTQGFFAALLSGDPFAGVSQERGKFRAWMLAALNHFLHNQHDHASAKKRGGGSTILSVEALREAEGMNWEPADAALPPDREFDRRWALSVMEQALSSVDQDYAKRGAADQFAALKPFLTGRPAAGGYDSLAAQLGTTQNNVAVAVKRLRERFRERVRHTVRETVGSAADLEGEMAYLFAALRGS
jgi:RNA polymerase sigma-70 factor (ECF subfamily)